MLVLACAGTLGRLQGFRVWAGTGQAWTGQLPAHKAGHRVYLPEHVGLVPSNSARKALTKVCHLEARILVYLNGHGLLSYSRMYASKQRLSACLHRGQCMHHGMPTVAVQQAASPARWVYSSNLRHAVRHAVQVCTASRLAL